MERNLALEVVRATEAAALAAARFIGKGDERMADRVAVRRDAQDAQLDRDRRQNRHWRGRSRADDRVPVRGRNRRHRRGKRSRRRARRDRGVAHLRVPAGPTLSRASRWRSAGEFCAAPIPTWTRSRAVRSGRGVIDIDKSPTDNLKALAESKRVYVEDLRVAILDRPRHEKLINEVRRAGAGIKIISAGDLSAAIATTRPESEIDMLIGIGGAHQGVLAGAAIRSAGGEMQCRFVPRNPQEAEACLAGHHGFEASLYARRTGRRQRDVCGDRELPPATICAACDFSLAARRPTAS